MLCTLLSVGVFTLSNLRSAQAADNDFSNGITVDSTGDGADANVGDGVCDNGSGNCTLRAALQEANDTAGAQTINFNISGTADFTNGGQDGYTIAPLTALPNITDTVAINGYSQPGSQVNTALAPQPLNGVLLIQIDGTNAGNNTIGFLLNTGGAGTIIRGLVISNFDGIAVQVNGGVDNVEVKGNYIGTDPSGLVQAGNAGQGISTFAASDQSGGPENGKIGGLLAADRNIISGNDSQSNDPNLATGVQGISLYGGSNNWVIQGNYVGVAADGQAAIPNELGGITIDYIDGLLIGGTEVGAANVFSGNGDGGIQPDYSSNIQIKGNFIGTDYTGANPVPNGTKGISFAFGTVDSIVGGPEAGAANVIAYNNDVGIYTNDSVNDVSVIGNRIHSNGDIGIDNGFDGVTLNDPSDSDAGPNDLLNFPTYDTYSEVGADTVVNYRLDVPAGDYRIEFFSNTTQDASGYGEGEEHLGFQNVSHPGNGVATFSYTLAGVTGVTNLALTTTERNATTVTGFGATSEFGGVSPPNTDLSIEKQLLNPQEVAQGATLEYQITVTNEGYSAADLSDYGNPGFGPALFYDFAPPELSNAQPYAADGPLPNSWILDVSNSDLACLWAEAGGGFFGSTTYAEYGVMACYYTGGDTNLAPGGTITANFTFDLSNSSDLIFNNYAFVSTLPDDPDTDIIIQTTTDEHNGITIDFVIETQSSFNNISVSGYPKPVDPDDAGQASQESESNNPLANTGQDIRIFGAIAIAIIVLAVYLARQARSYTYIAGR